jgi:hypothetical protein
MDEQVRKALWHDTIGQEFQRAYYLLIAEFDVVNQTWTEQVARPSYYCGGLAIEHFIKGCLVLKGVRFPTNARGHDLVHLMSLSNEINTFFSFTDEDMGQITILNERYYSHPIYGSHDLRYGTVSGTRTSPHPDNLNRVINQMEVALRAGITSLI